MDYSRTLEEAKNLFQQDKLAEVLIHLNTLEKTPEYSSNPDFFFQVADLKSQIFRLQDDLTLLVQLAEEVIAGGHEFLPPLRVVDILINIINAFAELDYGNFSYFRKEVNTVFQNIDPQPTREYKLRNAAVLTLLGRDIGKTGFPLPKAIDYLQQGLALYQELDDKGGMAYVLTYLSWIYFYEKNDLELAREYAQRSLTLATEIQHKRCMSHALITLGHICNRKGQYQEAITYHKKVLAIREELGDKLYLSWARHNLVNLYQSKKETWNLALELQFKNVEMWEQIGLKSKLVDEYNNIGDIYDWKGELNQAHDYYEKALKIAEELGYPNKIALTILNISMAYRKQGEISLAMELCHKGINILTNPQKESQFRDSDTHSNVYAWFIGELGHLHWQQNDLEEAYSYFKQNLQLIEELRGQHTAARIDRLFHLVLLCIDLDFIEEAKTYLETLKKFSEKRQSLPSTLWLWQTQVSRLAEAVILKSSTRAWNRVKAEELLESILNEETTNYLIKNLATFYLSELLLFELRVTGEVNVLKQLHSLVTRLLQDAEAQSSYSLSVETYILQAKLSLLELDLDRAQNLFLDGQAIAREKKLTSLVDKITHELNVFRKQQSQWAEFARRKAPIGEVLEFTQLEKYLSQISCDRLFQREAHIQSYSQEAQQLFRTWEKSG